MKDNWITEVKLTLTMKHNPNNLTPEQIQTDLGYRLLDLSEIKYGPDLLEIELWIRTEWNNKGWEGSDLQNTYRTKLRPQELANLRYSKQILLPPNLPCPPPEVKPDNTILIFISNRLLFTIAALELLGIAVLIYLILK